MDYIWSPWRFRYVSKAAPEDGCVFCRKLEEARDAENFILHRGAHCFLILNLYPYTAGHLMAAPYQHAATLEELSEEAAGDLMRLTRAASRALREVYKPRGLNIGMNIGECAGAGIAGHLHMHLLPRWPGDVNFMTAIGETRVLPEELPVTYGRVKEALAAMGLNSGG